MAGARKTLAVAQTSDERVEFLKTLPKLSITELPLGDHCPICLTPFNAISENGPTEQQSGVTKLPCGHIFCMADISEWIHTLRGSCPTCRDLFLIIPEPADDESSDGGEYIPGSDSIGDDMMDGETWTDEDGDAWTDGEEMSLDEGITEGETSSSWERSSDEVVVDVEDSNNSPFGTFIASSVDATIITEADEGSSMIRPCDRRVLLRDSFGEAGIEADDPSCEQIKAELIQWRTRVGHIQLHDWVSRKEETRATIHQGFCALSALKPRIDAIESDTSAKHSFVHYALATVQELHREMRSKLDMIHNIDRYSAPQANSGS